MLERPKDIAENTHLFLKGKYYCTDDLLFNWFAFDQTCKSLSFSESKPV